MPVRIPTFVRFGAQEPAQLQSSYIDELSVIEDSLRAGGGYHDGQSEFVGELDESGSPANLFDW